MLQERSLSQGMAPHFDGLAARARIVRFTSCKWIGEAYPERRFLTQ